MLSPNPLRLAVSHYLEFILSVRHYSPASIPDIRSTLSSFAGFCEDLSITAPTGITPQTTLTWARCERARDPLSGAPYVRTSTLRKNYAHLKGFFAYLVATQAIPRDPSAFLRLTSRKGVKVMNSLTVAQAERLLDAADPSTPTGLRNRVVIGLLWLYGLRCEELVSLDVGDIDFAQSTLTIRHGKGDKARVLPLLPGVVPRLQQYVALRRAGQGATPVKQPLLVNSRGGRLSKPAVNRILAEAAQAVGLCARVTALTLRHSFASHLAEASADISVISRLMGHRSLAETSPYMHVSLRALREAVDLLSPTIPPIPERTPEELRRLPYQGPRRRPGKEPSNG